MGGFLHYGQVIGVHQRHKILVVMGELARRVRSGDRVAYYALTITMGGKDSYQSFVAIGLVQAGAGFVPNRLDVA